MSDSLLKPDDGEQPALPGVPAHEVFIAERMMLKGDFTGERLFAQKPDLYKAVVNLLAQGWGSQRIADTLEVSKNTVKAVRQREGLTIERVKERLSDESFDLATDAFEAAKIIVEEVMSDPYKRKKLTLKDAKDLAVVGGVAVQNGQLLSGAPTSRVGVQEIQTPEHDAYNAYLESLKKIPPAIDPAKTIDLPPPTESMGLAGETRGQKEGGERAGNAAGDAPAAPSVPGSAPDARTGAEADTESEP